LGTDEFRFGSFALVVTYSPHVWLVDNGSREKKGVCCTCYRTNPALLGKNSESSGMQMIIIMPASSAVR